MQQSNSSLFTEDEMNIVRQTDLTSLFSSLGYQVKRKGSYHTLAEMPQIMIKRRISYYHNYDRQWGDGITFLRAYHNMNFEQAVNCILSFNGFSKDKPASAKPCQPAPHQQEAKEKAEFILPEPNSDCRRIYAYLMKRGISSQVVGGFISRGLLYECKERHNCVFVGMNANQEAVFAYKRGTYDKDGMGFKGDVPGSDKIVAFSLPPNRATETLHVFESPIDIMSHMTLHPQVNINALALCCLHDSALERYLSDYPHIRQIILCLDSDMWGKEASERIAEKYEAQGYGVSTDVPTEGKDWNEYLQRLKQIQQRDSVQNVSRQYRKQQKAR